MSIRIYTRVSHPPLLLGGHHYATIINLSLSIFTGLFWGGILKIMAQIFLGQFCIVVLTYKNLYFFDEWLSYIKCLDYKAASVKGQIYV